MFPDLHSDNVEEENIKLHLDRQAISDEIEKYMKEFFYCVSIVFLGGLQVGYGI